MNHALLSLFLAAFSIGTTEFVVAGLLPEISRDLGVSVPTAGLLVSGYAIGVAVGGPILSLLTSHFPRKPTILLLMAIFIGGHIFCALAPSYALLMGARIVIAMSHGSFFGLAAIIAVSIVPPNQRGAAISLVFAGLTVANILGVPLGTVIGNAFGWRSTFWVVGGLAVLATLAMAMLIPKGAASQQASSTLRQQFRVLGRHEVYFSYLLITVMMIGFWSVFTYVAPLLVQVTGLSSEWVPWALLMFGLGATAGIFAGGRLADRAPSQTLLIAFPVQGLIYVGLLLFPGSAVAMIFLLFAIGAGTFIVGSTLQNRILHGAAEAPDLASTLISSVYNVGIATGAFAGAAALNAGTPYQMLPWCGVVLSVVVSGLAVMLVRRDHGKARRLASAA